MINVNKSDVEHRKQELLDSMPIYYQESPEANAIMAGNAQEIEHKKAEADDLLNQLFVQTATWGLDYWDRVLALPPAPRMSIDRRRTRILAKLNGTAPATAAYLESVVNAHLRYKTAKLVEVNDQYRFEINIQANSPVELLNIASDMDELKPAHLDYAFRQITRSELYCAATLSAGEEVSVYPWSPTSIEVSGKVSLGSYMYDYDTTSVYPLKGEI